MLVELPLIYPLRPIIKNYYLTRKSCATWHTTDPDLHCEHQRLVPMTCDLSLLSSVNVWLNPCSRYPLKKSAPDASVAAHSIREFYGDQSKTETQNEKKPAREKAKEQKHPTAPDQ
ncbi:MAG TPA: hypothetical protein VGK77_28915 [Candidatus Binatia bacterium]